MAGSPEIKVSSIAEKYAMSEAIPKLILWYCLKHKW